MRIFRFDSEVGKPIEKFGSSNLIITRIVSFTGSVHINCFHLEAKGLVGYHQAVVPQLFLVVDGKGWVRAGDSSERQIIAKGQAAYWDKEEWHESGTDDGMTVIVVEGDTLDPMPFLKK